MRDNHDGLPEILNPFEKDGNYFGVVHVSLPTEKGTFEFGVSAAGHSTLKRILNTRPFDAMPAIPYRYFFTGSASQREPGVFSFGVRIEQGSTAKQFDFMGPKDLLANLMWFQQLSSLEPAAHLKQCD